MTLIGIVVSAIAGLGGIAFKWWLAQRKNTTQQAVDTSHAMLKDAANRTDPADVAGDMRRGEF